MNLTFICIFFFLSSVVKARTGVTLTSFRRLTVNFLQLLWQCDFTIEIPISTVSWDWYPPFYHIRDLKITSWLCLYPNADIIFNDMIWTDPIESDGYWPTDRQVLHILNKRVSHLRRMILTHNKYHHFTYLFHCSFLSFSNTD